MNTRATKKRFDEFPAYMGGHTTLYGGYVYEFAPAHPLANTWGFVAQHRLVAESMIGRSLVQSEDPKVRECVHHIDEDRTNNHPSNLQVLTFSEHRSLHGKAMAIRNRANLTTESVKDALAKHRSIFLAAKALHVHHQTLRNRFPSLVKPFLRASPFDAKNTQDRERLLEVLRHFAPTHMSFAELATLTRTCAKQLATLCRDNGIQWERTPLGAPGKRRKTYRGVPTRYAKELRDSQIEPE